MGHSGGAKKTARAALVYIDMAYDLDELEKQGRKGFLQARNRGRLFNQVFSVHPVAGLVRGQTAGKFRIRRAGAHQVVLDGFHPARKLIGWRKVLNLLHSQVRMWRVTARLAQRADVRLVVATDVFYLGLMGLFAARLAGKPLAVAAYQNQDELYEHSGQLAFPRLIPWRWLERAVQRVVLSSADVVEAPTQNMRRYLSRNGAREAAIATLPVARFIDPLHLKHPSDRASASPLLRALGCDPAAPRMVMISRLIAVKLVEDGVSAMIEVCRRLPFSVGLVFGDGDLADRLQEHIESEGMARQILLAGKADQDALSRICAGAVIISPLTGMALVEASLAGGVPVVYDRDWQPEFVINAVNGYVVPFRDVGSMAARAEKLLREPLLFSAMSARSRDAGLAFADPELHLQREKSIFCPLIGAQAELMDHRS